MSTSETFSEVVEILATLEPVTANGTVAAHATGYFSMADVHRAFVFVQLGQAGAPGSTMDISLQQATDQYGTGAKALEGKAPAQITGLDTGYVGIEVNSTEMDVTHGYDYLQVTVTIGVNTFTYSLVVLGWPMRYGPTDATGYLELVE